MTTLVLSILNGSSSVLYTKRTAMKDWMSLNFVNIPLLRYRMAGITESAMVAYTHKYAVV